MYTIGQLNASVYRNMQNLLSGRLSDLTIKNGQYDFFLVISSKEGISQKKLSEYLHISKSTTAKAVKNLVSKGYVVKEKDKKDGRIDHLYLTDLGKEKKPVVEKIFRETLKIAGKGLSAEENSELLRIMEKVLNNLVAENALPSKRSNDNE